MQKLGRMTAMENLVEKQAAGCPLTSFEKEILAPPCECEQPGHFNSGLPGALANVVAGKLNSQVERCDLCQRYPSDAAARKALLEKLAADWKRKAEAL